MTKTPKSSFVSIGKQRANMCGGITQRFIEQFAEWHLLKTSGLQFSGFLFNFMDE